MTSYVLNIQYSKIIHQDQEGTSRISYGIQSLFSSPNLRIHIMQIMEDPLTASLISILMITLIHQTEATVSRLNVACGESPVHCYILYGASPSVTWTEARDSCSGMNSSLAVIQNQAAQHVIQRLPRQGGASVQHAWIGGKRSADRRWTDIEGKVFGLMLPSSEKNPRCAKLYVSVDIRQVATLTDQPCFDTTNTGFKALCQVKDTTCNRICRPWGCVRGYTISSVCHVVTSTALISWEEARQYCRSRYQGELAYSVLNLNIKDLNVDHKGQYLWIGAQTQHWVWITDGGEKTFTYVNWTPGEGNAEDCALVDLNTNAPWRDKPCTELNKYFVCEITLLTTSTTTTTIKTRELSTTLKEETAAITTPSTTKTATGTGKASSSVQATSTTPAVNLNTISAEFVQYIGHADSAMDETTTNNYFGTGKPSNGVMVALICLFATISVISVSANIYLGMRLASSLKEDPGKAHDYYNMSNGLPDESTVAPPSRYDLPPEPLDPYEICGPSGCTESDNRVSKYDSLQITTRDSPQVATPVYDHIDI